ncbi:hypothetical protein [Sphingomonas sp.]|uniref:hypothetical protein n=1 Tax=Sphingomonas sp. TaxID=28214 RepID=UPI003B3A74A4
MRKLRLFVMVALFSTNAIAGVGGFPKLSGFTITSVKVIKTGQWTPDPRYPKGERPGEGRAACAAIKVSPRTMKYWFSQAVQLDHPSWMERTTWTQCYSEGVLTSRNRKYYWFLDPAGRGNISTQPGQRGKVVYLAGPSIVEPGTFGLDGLDPGE